MNNTSTCIDKQHSPLDRLRMLLESQVNMLRNSDLRSLEGTLGQINSILEEMKQNPQEAQSESKEKIKAILDVYKRLQLMIEAGKEITNKQLQKVVNGQRTLRAYHR